MANDRLGGYNLQEISEGHNKTAIRKKTISVPFDEQTAIYNATDNLFEISVEHNLGYMPVVQVYEDDVDDKKNLVICAVRRDSPNKFTIRMTNAFSGEILY